MSESAYENYKKLFSKPKYYPSKFVCKVCKTLVCWDDLYCRKCDRLLEWCSGAVRKVSENSYTIGV